MKFFANKIVVLTCGLAMWSAPGLFGQEKHIPADSLRKMFDQVSKDPLKKDQAALIKQLELFSNSNDENDLLTAANYYSRLKMEKTGDSIVKIAKQRFPLGYSMRSDGLDSVNKETDPFKKERKFKEWISRYPVENFTGVPIIYDYARAGVAHAFARAGQGEKAVEYADQLALAFWRGEGLAGIANSLLKSGDTVRALPLIKKAVETSRAFLNPKPDDNQAQFAALGYPYYCLRYAEIEGKYKKDYAEAIKYIELAGPHMKSKSADYYITYATALKSVGRADEGLKVLETSVLEGMTDNRTDSILALVYREVKKDTSGYSAYRVALKKQMNVNIAKKVRADLISEPAAGFTLKDMHGQTVSLSDMKGKVVVLDFWATWCGPCVRSFPAMQKAVNKYKADPNVKFLFIDTWENSANYETLVKEFMTKNKYDFHVLFDPRSKETNQSKVASGYNVTGIPAKFVIDGNGKIRFKLTGFNGSEDAAVHELSTMIEIAKKGA